MAPYDIGFRPEDLIPNVVFSPEGGTLTKDDAKKLGEAQRWLKGHPDEAELLCRACGWNAYHELVTAYLPRLRIFHTRANAGLWHMGNDWLIWDRRGDTGMETNEYMTYKFLRDQGTKDIPLVKEMHQFGKEGDKFVFTVMSRVKGVTLESVWTKLTPEEKRSYADQLIAALRELRQFTASSPQRVDGSPLSDSIIGRCNVPKLCKTIPATKEEWLKNVDEELRVGIKLRIASTMDGYHKPSPESEYQEIHTTFPESAPFVLTHSDLNMTNIMVDDGKILAIIDWEGAGYYPWWVERWASYARSVSANADELFDMVWAGIDPEMSRADFVTKAYRPVELASYAFNAAPKEHTQTYNVWLRPRWCECKPMGGICDGANWGAELDHVVKQEEWPYWLPTTKTVHREVAPEAEEARQEGGETLEDKLEKIQL
jgi:hypothetical protein